MIERDGGVGERSLQTDRHQSLRGAYVEARRVAFAPREGHLATAADAISACDAEFKATFSEVIEPKGAASLRDHGVAMRMAAGNNQPCFAILRQCKSVEQTAFVRADRHVQDDVPFDRFRSNAMLALS